MTNDEAKTLLDSMDAPIVKVWATPSEGNEYVAEYRFPGMKATGYFVATRRDVLTFLPWLNIDKIEVW